RRGDPRTAATVVTGDGHGVRGDEGTNADLFWGLRGGGGGNFGVVTSFTFATHRVDRITSFGLSWPWSDAADVLDAWQTWGPAAAPELWSSCRVRWIPSTGPTVSVGGAWLGAPDRLAARPDALVSAVGSSPSSRTASTTTSLERALSLQRCACGR